MNVEPPLQVLAFILAPVPHPQTLSIESLQDRIFNRLLPYIPLSQVSVSLAYLIPDLHAHGPFRQRAHESLQRLLGAVPRVVRMKERVEADCFVTRYERTVRTNDDIVEIVSNGQQLA
jgi:hypothetical protein